MRPQSLIFSTLLAAFALPSYSAPFLNMSSSASPTIVLVPGAFHVDSSMDLLGAQMAQAGYNTRTMGLITVNHPKVNVQADAVELLITILSPLIEQQGKDVVLYLHSYAGFPGSTVIKGLSKQERLAAGKQGGILGLIYQSAFIPKEGNTLLQMIGGSYAPWQDANVCLLCCS